MVIQDYEQRGSHDRGAYAQPGSDEAREHAALEHERSAERYDRHAALLDRHGAHRSANTERRHAEEERRDAAAARPSTTRGPGSGHRAGPVQG
jgi:hypothetical protein